MLTLLSDRFHVQILCLQIELWRNPWSPHSAQPMERTSHSNVCGTFHFLKELKRFYSKSYFALSSFPEKQTLKENLDKLEDYWTQQLWQAFFGETQSIKISFMDGNFFKQNSLIRSLGQKCQISNNETAGSD